LNGDQVRTAWALYAGVVPDSLREKVEAHLLNLLQTQNYLDIGSFGRYPFYKTVLNSDKYAEILGAILDKTTYPSYGYFLENHCTTFPEMWEIDQPNSTLIHTSYTGISAFFIKYLAGIQEASSGCDTILIHPHPIAQLNNCSAEIETPYGKIKSSWKREKTKIKYYFEIPFGVEAKIKLPNQTQKTEKQYSCQNTHFFNQKTSQKSALQHYICTRKNKTTSHAPLKQGTNIQNRHKKIFLITI
jgi:alpha-L-rhamnosidase